MVMDAFAKGKAQLPFPNAFDRETNLHVLRSHHMYIMRLIMFEVSVLLAFCLFLFIVELQYSARGLSRTHRYNILFGSVQAHLEKLTLATKTASPLKTGNSNFSDRYLCWTYTAIGKAKELAVVNMLIGENLMSGYTPLGYREETERALTLSPHSSRWESIWDSFSTWRPL